MQILEKLNALLTEKDIQVQKNGTRLVGVPVGHYLYAPMTIEMQKELVASYRGDFPEELLQIYGITNGCTLFLTSRKIGMLTIPFSQLNVYGVPGGRNAVDALEPYHISIEDLGRPGKTPKTWLKFGSYSPVSADRVEWRLFVDTKDKRVYAVDADAKTCVIESQWESIDACLCDLFDRLQNL